MASLRCDSILLRDLLLVVDIYFRESYSVGLGVLGGERFKGWGNGFAGPAPVCVDCGCQLGKENRRRWNLQSVTTIFEEDSRVLNWAAELMLTVILVYCWVGLEK